MADRPFLPYGRQWIRDEDRSAVDEVLHSDWLTTGPALAAFEQSLCEATGAEHAIAVANGTAALHAAYAAAGVGEGDEVIVPAQTFSATANAALYLGATVRFADVDDTLTVDPESVRQLVNDRTRVITPVDFAGHPADMDAIAAIADECGATVVHDAAHSLGASYKGRPVGSIAALTTFSFHPVKLVTTAEGGAVLTNDKGLAQRLNSFRNHGMVRGWLAGDEDAGEWAYDIDTIGFNYRLSDVHAALGRSQLGSLEPWIDKRNQIASWYGELLSDVPDVATPPVADWCTRHAFHLYVVQVPAERRKAIFEGLRAEQIGVQVHYIPVNMLAIYRERGHSPEDTPAALTAYRRMLSLPCFPLMNREDVERVVAALRNLISP